VTIVIVVNGKKVRIEISFSLIAALISLFK